MSTVREIDRILDQLQRAYDGDAWYGESVRSALDGVDVQLATRRPLPAAHTIFEIVLHVTAWTREITRRLQSGIARDPADGDWPAIAGTDDRAWTAALAALEQANQELVETIAALDEGVLEERIGDVRDRPLGSGVSRYVTLHGLVQHHVYHAGQIALLRKAADRPATS